MKALVRDIRILQNSPINKIIEQRLREFSSFRLKSDEEWFSELCFCILAANSKQKTAEIIQKQLSIKKLNEFSIDELAIFIRNNKHRFHNNKARYLKQALEFKNIKSIVSQKTEGIARDWLVDNVYGIGYKEASHFLRNTGSKNLAILDRHILAVLIQHGLINNPKTLTKNIYFGIEKELFKIAEKLNVSLAKLDLFLWYSKTGEVLK